MAITAAKQLKDFDKNFLPPEQAASIFDDAVKGSVAMQMFQRQELGPAGVSFPILTNKPTANWVAEAGKKPTTQADVGIVTMKPQKIAAIAVISQEVVRANPADYAQTLRTHLADAFAVAFDLAVFHNKGGDGTGTGPFDHHVAETTKSVEVSGDGTKLYDELVQAITLNVKGTPKKKVTGLRHGFRARVPRRQGQQRPSALRRGPLRGPRPGDPLRLCPGTGQPYARERR